MIVLNILGFILLSVWLYHRAYYLSVRDYFDHKGGFWPFLRFCYHPTGFYVFMTLLDIAVKAFSLYVFIKIIRFLWLQF